MILNRLYESLERRIQHIDIALLKQRIPLISIGEHYDLTRTDMPTVGETEDAFYRWNCGILTAFRGSDTLSKEDNLARNLARNEELKSRLREQGLRFRAVDGWYKEYGTETYVKELSMFVTNTDLDAKDFFIKLYRLAEYYEQDCFLFTFPGMNRVAFLVATNDGGRAYFRDDVKFAGPLFTHIEGLDAWTQCKDGKISFILKGMIEEGGTGNKKVRIGEGNFFDVEGYNADGIGIVYGKAQDDLKDACHEYKGSKPLVKRFFAKDNPTEQDVHNKTLEVLRDLREKKCRRIGFHCSAAIDGSYVKGAEVAYNTILAWAKRNDKKFDTIIIVDTYGDYAKIK